MRAAVAMVLALSTGFALGATVQGLNAQSRPQVYHITEIETTNAEAFTTDYAPKAMRSFKNAGGHYLAVAGEPPLLKVIALDGVPPKRVAVQVWDSLERLEAWRSTAEYAEIRRIGEKHARFRSYALEGLRFYAP